MVTNLLCYPAGDFEHRSYGLSFHNCNPWTEEMQDRAVVAVYILKSTPLRRVRWPQAFVGVYSFWLLLSRSRMTPGQRGTPRVFCLSMRQGQDLASKSCNRKCLRSVLSPCSCTSKESSRLSCSTLSSQQAWVAHIRFWG